MKKLKVALVHDYIKEYGGAERVLETLHEMFPEAPVYTSVYLPRFLGPHRERLSDWDIRTSWAQRIPFVHKLISPLRLISPWIFSSFDLSSYDVVIVSATGAYEPNMVRTKKRIRNQESGIRNEEKGTIHICYCHTPPRYLYGYATARDWKSNKLMLVAGAIMSHFLRMVDFSAAQRVDYFVANSEEVAGRILKFYRKKATVIYPPVDIQMSGVRRKISVKKRVGSYFLTGGRLARAKHVDLIVRACIELGVPLKVFGRGFAGYEEELKKIADVRHQISDRKDEGVVDFVGEVSDEEKAELMSNAKAFIFAGEDEDFGITPIEAMSFGLPVIAYRSGGVKETVIDGVTGVFFTQLRVESLKRALRDFERMRIDPEECIEQSKQFSKERFVKEFGIFLDKVL